MPRCWQRAKLNICSNLQADLQRCLCQLHCRQPHLLIALNVGDQRRRRLMVTLQNQKRLLH